MIPNLLTIGRFLLIPLILWLATRASTAALGAGLGLFVAAGISDWLDGFLARRWDQITPFGKLMDPIADKMLVLGLLFVFSHLRLLPLWIPLVHLFRELLVSGVRSVFAARGTVVGANWMGKTKFWLQLALCAEIFAWLIAGSAGLSLEGSRRIVLWSAVGVTTVSVLFGANFLRWHAEELFSQVPERGGN
jgi:CDP-diacylglycerol--glycerol-3-phosphate 3-phosphatidyltransferase